MQPWPRTPSMGTDLDIEQPGVLLSYLRGTGRIGEEEEPVVHVLAGGVSNRTVLVERPTGEAWVLKQALEKLRVSVDWFSDPERVHREALGLRWLQELAPPGSITPLVFEDHEHHLLAMEAVPEPHENWKTMLLEDRKSTRLNSSHANISYAVFCLKKKNTLIKYLIFFFIYTYCIY